VLQPGALVFIPSYWLHALHGFGDGGVQSVNLWFWRQLELKDAIAKQQH
jgi:hypothetical protein